VKRSDDRVHAIADVLYTGKARSIPTSDSVTSRDIVRVVLRVGQYNQTQADIIQMFADEGRSAYDATMAYCAALTYITISSREYKENV
jgi:hypothetical protein